MITATELREITAAAIDKRRKQDLQAAKQWIDSIQAELKERAEAGAILLITVRPFNPSEEGIAYKLLREKGFTLENLRYDNENKVKISW